MSSMKNIDDVLEYLTKQREMNKPVNPEKQVDFKELTRERRYENGVRRTLVDARIRESSDPSYRVTPDVFVCDRCSELKPTADICWDDGKLHCFECFDELNKVTADISEVKNEGV